MLDSDGTRLDNTKLSIKRIDGTTTIETKQQEFIDMTLYLYYWVVGFEGTEQKIF